jgi:hypothetical protein
MSTLAISTIGLLLNTEEDIEGGTRALSRLLSSIGEERVVLLSLDVHILNYDEDHQATALQLVHFFITSGINPTHLLGEESGRPMILYREWSGTEATPVGQLAERYAVIGYVWYRADSMHATLLIDCL